MPLLQKILVTLQPKKYCLSNRVRTFRETDSPTFFSQIIKDGAVGFIHS